MTIRLKNLALTWCLLHHLCAHPTVTFKVDRVSPHVYTAHPLLVDRVNSTSAVIVGHSYLVVVDPQTDIYMGEKLIEAIRKNISKLPIKYLIYTHFHSDHVGGASAFIKENPTLTIIAHEEARVQIEKGLVDEEKNNLAGIVKSIAEKTKAEIEKEPDTMRKQTLLKSLDNLNHYYEDTKKSPIVSPNLTFNDSLNLYVDSLEVKLHSFGTGHTPSDVVLYLPQEKVLMTGDLVHAFEPLFFHADPEGWISILEHLKGYDFKFMIGGHGDYHIGKQTLVSWQDYLKELHAYVTKGMQSNTPLALLLAGAKVEQFPSLLKDNYGHRIQEARTRLMSDRFIGSLEEAVKSEVEFIYNIYTKPHKH